MLLVRLDDVVDKWAIWREKKTSYLKSLSMPFLRRPDFAVFFRRAFLCEFGSLKSDLCTNTEIGNNIQDDFLKHGVL